MGLSWRESKEAARDFMGQCLPKPTPRSPSRFRIDRKLFATTRAAYKGLSPRHRRLDPILQQLHDLTDAVTVEAVAFNITWHYALDIRAESDACLCKRTLRNDRRLLIEKGLDQVLFRSLTDRLIKAVGTETGKQSLDSTAIRSAMRGLARLGIIVESIRKFFRELRRRHPALHDQVDSELIPKYVDRQGSGCFACTKPSESKRRLPGAAAELLGLVNQFRLSVAAELES